MPSNRVRLPALAVAKTVGSIGGFCAINVSQCQSNKGILLNLPDRLAARGEPRDD